MKTLPVEAREELAASYTYDPINGTTACATHLAAVEIDPASCFVHISKFVVAEDCGQIINPMIVDGQVHGGVAQGIGAALYEELVYDEEGQLLTASLVDYVIPSAPEVPEMDVVHVESESAVAGGFRGMGEGGTIGAPAAIANAIADALSPLGLDVSILPMTPERIFRLIEQAKQKEGKSDV
jgi:carbon-monoxide dehydrogenase large subunit